MNTDPGWRAALKHGLVALVARHRVMELRPAITAARASTLAFIYGAVAVAGVLSFLSETAETDYLFTGLMVLAGSTASTFAVFFYRNRPPKGIREEGTAVLTFLAISNVISAFAAVPMLIGFVTFFLGGGYLPYGGRFVVLASGRRPSK